MPYQVAPVLHSYCGIFEPGTDNNVDKERKKDIFKAILRILKITNVGGSASTSKRMEHKEAVPSGTDAKYSSERINSIFDTIYSQIYSSGTMLFSLPHDVVSELQVCEFTGVSRSRGCEKVRDKTSDSGCSINLGFNYSAASAGLSDELSAGLKRIATAKYHAQDAARRIYFPTYGEVLNNRLPTAVLGDVIATHKRAYLVLDNSTTSPQIHIKFTDETKFGDKDFKSQSRTYALERIANTFNETERWLPYVLGEIVNVYRGFRFTKALHTWSPAITLYCRKHTQLHGISSMSTAAGSTYSKHSHGYITTRYKLDLYMQRSLVSHYLMGWLSPKRQDLFVISEGFFGENITYEKLLAIVDGYVKAIDFYRLIMTSSANVGDDSDGNSDGDGDIAAKPSRGPSVSKGSREDASNLRSLVLPSISKRVLALAENYDFLLQPYCSLVANSPLPYILSSTQVQIIRSIIDGTFILNQEKLQQCYFSENDQGVDMASVVCCNVSKVQSEPTTEIQATDYDSKMFNQTLQCTTIEDEELVCIQREQIHEDVYTEMKDFPTYETLRSFLRARLQYLKFVCFTASSEDQIADSAATEPTIKLQQGLCGSDNCLSDASDCSDSDSILIHDLVYETLHGSLLSVCDTKDKLDYTLCYQNHISHDGYAHIAMDLSCECVIPSCSPKVHMYEYKRHACLSFYTLPNVVQRRYTQLAVYNSRAYALLKDFHANVAPLCVLISVCTHVADALFEYPFCGMFVSTIQIAWLGYDVAGILDCLFSIIGTFFLYSPAETYKQASLSNICSYPQGNITVERYLRHSIPWFWRPQTIFEFLFSRVQDNAASTEIISALRSIFRFSTMFRQLITYRG